MYLGLNMPTPLDKIQLGLDHEQSKVSSRSSAAGEPIVESGDGFQAAKARIAADRDDR